jgi:predicted nucleotidyltransferase/uncharacterized protein (UPF0332 family)
MKKKSTPKKKTSPKKSIKQVAKKSFPVRKIVNEEEIAQDFAERVHLKFDRMLKASVLFGSQAKKSSTPNSDIDIILIIDDAGINWDLELIAWYREELGKIIKVSNYQKSLHVNTIKLTTWWHDLIKGDPVVLNILRYGQPLIDSGGFFEPQKALLLQGKIHSTNEAAYAALQRVPDHLARSRMSELAAIEGVYWAMVDAAQAALIVLGKLPPSPEHLPQMLNDHLVKSGLLKDGHVRALRDLYKLHKSISRKEIHDIRGSEIDKWQDLADKFALDISKAIDKIIQTKKEVDSN